MEISVIIVNYNVRYFLEQCLCSVEKALNGMGGEVIVIDNQSSDQSIEYLQPAFPTVRFVANAANGGFAKACNQGLAMASGRYILFLNPDTIVGESCFRDCIRFMEAHPDAGALGVKMLDGSGRFLPESKRAFPSPFTSFYKLSGLSLLFPKSPRFARYHLGHLDPSQPHEVDVLAGAFMLIRKEVLDKTGGFDETFFMYGEDVDLSYRIQQAGYKNYYFPGSPIIHFKGESTRKGSMNYVRMFYSAMSLFVRKHYGGSRAGVFNLIIHLAIWVRAGLSATGRFIRRIGLPLIDASLILLAFWLMKNLWNSVRSDVEYQNDKLWIAFPAYTLFYLITAYYAGLYDRAYKRSDLVRSSVVASVVLLAAYSLLPEQYRFSRAIILFGAVLGLVFIMVLRYILTSTGVLESVSEDRDNASTLIAADADEYRHVLELMQVAGLQERVLGRISVSEQDNTAIGNLKQIQGLPDAVPFREIIYCQGKLSFAQIIESIQSLPAGVHVKFHAAGSRSIVGSDSRDGSGESVSVETSLKLADPYYRRIKRLIDTGFSLLFLLTFPAQFILVRKPFRFLARALQVLLMQMTWVGYTQEEKKLPGLRNPVLACNGLPASVKQQIPAESLHMLDYWYARDYEPVNDIRLVLRSYRKLGD